MAVVDTTNGWFVSWNTCHNFGRDTTRCRCSLWRAGDTACLPTPGKSFPCFTTRGTHLSPRILPLLELPNPSRRPQRTHQLLEKRKDQEWQPKWHRQCYAALAQALIVIQNVSSTPMVIPALAENGARFRNQEARSTKVQCPPLSFVYYVSATDCLRWRFIPWRSPSPSFLQ